MPGTLPPELKEDVVELGRQVLAALPWEAAALPLFRADLACCLAGTGRGGWFLNEFTFFPDMVLNADGGATRSLVRSAEAYRRFAAMPWHAAPAALAPRTGRASVDRSTSRLTAELERCKRRVSELEH